MRTNKEKHFIRINDGVYEDNIFIQLQFLAGYDPEALRSARKSTLEDYDRFDVICFEDEDLPLTDCYDWMRI